MKKCVVLANCQGDAIAKILRRQPEYSELFTTEYACNYEYVRDGSPIPITMFENADLVVYQPLGGEIYQGLMEWLCTMGIHDRAISFPYIYNAGAFAMYEEGDKVYGSSPVLAIRDLGFAEIEKMIAGMAIDFKILPRYTDSMAEMKRRELGCDVAVSGEIERFIEKEQIFYTQNHVSNRILLPVVNAVLDKIGIQAISIEQAGEEAMVDFTWPLSPYEINAYGLQLPPDETWLSHMVRVADRALKA